MATMGHDSGSLSPLERATIIDLPSSAPSLSTFTFVVESDSPDSSLGTRESGHPVDRFSHTRQKRKRTSAVDFAVLEAEYSKNPRPDKAARNAIVKSVALDEKEVQIWFQNRRQMTRRKGKTWQPNEISSIIRSANDPASENADSVRSEGNRPSSSATERPESHPLERPGDDVLLPQNSQLEELPMYVQQLQNAIHGDEPKEVSAHIEGTRCPDGDSSSVAVISEGAPSSTLRASIPVAANQSHDVPGKTLKRTASAVRLSMSLDGKAQIVIDTNSPSPPAKPQVQPLSSRMGPLRRAKSTTAVGGLLDIGDVPPYPLQRPSGRSRDSRAWGFCCDRDSREALTVSAEHEKNGSAQGVLSLIRSSSASNKILTPSTRQNALIKRQDSNKRKSLENLENARPKLARHTSSLARLQSSNVLSLKPNLKASKSSSQLTVWQDAVDDSDKENWVPGTQTSRPRYRFRSPSAHLQGGVLTESVSIPSHSTSLDALMARENVVVSKRSRPVKHVEDQENVPASHVLDDEVEGFMSSGVRQVGDDLSAAKGLLSLSQGPW